MSVEEFAGAAVFFILVIGKALSTLFYRKSFFAVLFPCFFRSLKYERKYKKLPYIRSLQNYIITISIENKKEELKL